MPFSSIEVPVRQPILHSDYVDVRAIHEKAHPSLGGAAKPRDSQESAGLPNGETMPFSNGQRRGHDESESGLNPKGLPIPAQVPTTVWINAPPKEVQLA
jgi:hypothetical protein